MVVHVAVLSGDLAIGSTASAIGARNNGRISVTMSVAKLIEHLEHEPVDVIVIDLQARSLDRPLVDQLRSLAAPGCQIAAFGPHVQEALLQSAQQAGCDHVWTRGEWQRQLEAIVKKQND